MATHSSILAWRIPWTEELGELQSMGLQRVGHDRATNTHTDGSGVKSAPAMQETRDWPLGQEDPLEEEMATHSSILAWEVSWTEEPGGLQSMGLQRVGRDWATEHTLTFKNREISQKNRDSWIFLKIKQNRNLVKKRKVHANLDINPSKTYKCFLSNSRCYRASTMYHKGFSGIVVVKNLLANAGGLGSIPGLGRSPGAGHSNPLPYSCLEDHPMDRGAWRATVREISKESDTTELTAAVCIISHVRHCQDTKKKMVSSCLRGFLV